MRSHEEYIKFSLELNLFFLRIMKEHCYFIAVAAFPPVKSCSREYLGLMSELDSLLCECVALSDGAIGHNSVWPGQFITPYTYICETKTQAFFGIKINSRLTLAEAETLNRSMECAIYAPSLHCKTQMLNERACALAKKLIKLKKATYNAVQEQKIFTFIHPSSISHYLNEARCYYELLQALICGSGIWTGDERLKLYTFWDFLMADHAKMYGSMLDYAEDIPIRIANNFACEFTRLGNKTKAAATKSETSICLEDETMRLLNDFKSYNKDEVEGIVENTQKSVIPALMADHMLREANHYLRILEYREPPQKEPGIDKLLQSTV